MPRVLFGSPVGRAWGTPSWLLGCLEGSVLHGGGVVRVVGSGCDGSGVRVAGVCSCRCPALGVGGIVARSGVWRGWGGFVVPCAYIVLWLIVLMRRSNIVEIN